MNMSAARISCVPAMGRAGRRPSRGRQQTRHGEVNDIQADFSPGKDEPAAIADVSPARSYAARIVNSWRHAAEGMMEVARLCSEASERLTASEKKHLIGRLPFKEPTFSKFVQIGRMRG